MNDYNKIVNINIKQYNYISKRNYGIDLLRMLSMINIINLHINGFSGLLRSLKYNSSQFKPIWRLQAFSRWSVDSFGLISGIVGYKRHKFSNLIYIWITVFFYSNTISCYVYFIKKALTKKKLILSLFPILIKRHWYVNAYFQMYLLLPFINNGIKNLEKKTFKNIVLFFIFFYSIYYIFGTCVEQTDYNFLNNGYSGMWLLILYIIGAFFGKYILINTNKYNNIVYFLFFIILYLSSSFFSSELHFKLLKIKSKIYSKLFINYLSPTMLLQAISLIMFFSRLNVNNKLIIKIISFFTPLTFSVQLIHTRLFQVSKTIKLIRILFHYIKTFKNNLIFYNIYGFSIIIFLICSFIDYLRFLLFKLLKIRELSIYIEEIIPKLIDKL